MIYVYTGLYGHAILMICFTTIFGDTSSDVYGIYIVLHVAYGQTYVDAV